VGLKIVVHHQHTATMRRQSGFHVLGVLGPEAGKAISVLATIVVTV
jgi:hypothetical protein